MSEAKVTVLVQMHDKTKKAEVTLTRSTTTRDLLEETKKNWALPSDVNYNVTNMTKSRVLLPKDQFTEENVSDKDVLQIEPLLVPGILRVG